MGTNYNNQGTNYNNQGPNYNNQGTNYNNQGPNYNYQSSGPNYSGSGVTPLKTDRGLLGYIVLSILTCGIYSYYFIYTVARDVNTACAGDGKSTGGLVQFILLSILTCGIYSWRSVIYRKRYYYFIMAFLWLFPLFHRTVYCNEYHY